MKTTTILSTIILAFALSVPTAYSADKKKPADTPADPAKKPDAKKDHYPLYGQLVSITDKLVVTKGGQGKEDHKFDITKDTKITKDEKPATVKDAKEGQWVSGYVHKMEKGNPELVSLNLSPKQKEEKKPETTTTPKKK